MVLRGFVKLFWVVAIAGGVGLVVGVGVSQLSGGENSVDPSVAPSHSTTRPVPAPPGQVRVRVLDVVLHPAGTLDGQRRKRARVNARIEAENRGANALSAARPTLLVGATRTKTDSGADAPGTHFAALAPGQKAKVTLRFEVGGAVTAQLTSERRARISIAGHTLGIPIKIGDPIGTLAAASNPRG